MTRLELITDLGILRANAREIRRRIPATVRIKWVIKANAYGHGALKLARVLKNAGLTDGGFAVATEEEARELNAQGEGGPRAGDRESILILGAACAAGALDPGFTYTIGSADDVRLLTERCERGQKYKVHIKIDTGMSRLGARETQELNELLNALARTDGALETEGVFSHLCAADTDETFTQKQKKRFERALETIWAHGMRPIRHLAASTAMLRPEFQYDMVRAGIALYGTGVDALRGAVKPAQTLVSCPVAFHRLAPGDTVGYGRRFTARRDSLIMTVPCGYGDGYPRILGGRADVLVRGKRAPIVGNVCMDMLMADVTEIPGVDRHSRVVLMGSDGSECITPDELALKAETIPYEIMLGFSQRVKRSWIDSER